MLNKNVELYLHVTLPAATLYGFDLTILYYRSPTTKNVSFLLYMFCATVFLNFYLSTHLLIVITLHSLLGCLVLYSVIHYFLQHIFTCWPFSFSIFLFHFPQIKTKFSVQKILKGAYSCDSKICVPVYFLLP